MLIYHAAVWWTAACPGNCVAFCHNLHGNQLPSSSLLRLTWHRLGFCPLSDVTWWPTQNIPTYTWIIYNLIGEIALDVANSGESNDFLLRNWIIISLGGSLFTCHTYLYAFSPLPHPPFTIITATTESVYLHLYHSNLHRIQSIRSEIVGKRKRSNKKHFLLVYLMMSPQQAAAHSPVFN